MSEPTDLAARARRIAHANHLLDGLRDPIPAAFDRVIIRKRAEHLDRAVSLGIIDHGQRCALLELFIEELQALRAIDARAVITDAIDDDPEVPDG